ncbi:hypothetical protein HDE_12905 [Halotydeus destructor]|nr:hypothetical protein HDE_12905 [Halotydeus destructor]
MRYTDAVAYCSKFGGHLALPESLAEQQHISKLTNGGPFWLDMKPTTQSFVSMIRHDGSKVTWTNWANSEPFCRFPPCGVRVSTIGHSWATQGIDKTYHAACEALIPDLSANEMKAIEQHVKSLNQKYVDIESFPLAGATEACSPRKTYFSTNATISYVQSIKLCLRLGHQLVRPCRRGEIANINDDLADADDYWVDVRFNQSGNFWNDGSLINREDRIRGWSDCREEACPFFVDRIGETRWRLGENSYSPDHKKLAICEVHPIVEENVVQNVKEKVKPVDVVSSPAVSPAVHEPRDIFGLLSSNEQRLIRIENILQKLVENKIYNQEVSTEGTIPVTDVTN